AHAERRGVMLVEHDAVEAGVLDRDHLVEVAVVQLRADLLVVDGVAQGEVHDRLAGGAEVAGVRILVRPLGEVHREHRRRLSRPPAAVWTGLPPLPNPLGLRPPAPFDAAGDRRFAARLRRGTRSPTWSASPAAPNAGS